MVSDVPYISAFDLLMNCGPEGQEIILSGGRIKEKFTDHYPHALLKNAHNLFFDNIQKLLFNEKPPDIAFFSQNTARLTRC